MSNSSIIELKNSRDILNKESLEYANQNNGYIVNRGNDNYLVTSNKSSDFTMMNSHLSIDNSRRKTNYDIHKIDNGNIDKVYGIKVTGEEFDSTRYQNNDTDFHPLGLVSKVEGIYHKNETKIPPKEAMKIYNNFITSDIYNDLYEQTATNDRTKLIEVFNKKREALSANKNRIQKILYNPGYKARQNLIEESENINKTAKGSYGEPIENSSLINAEKLEKERKELIELRKTLFNKGR